MVLSIRPPHPLRISVPEGLCITPIPPRISYIPFHGLNLPYLEIIDCVPLKINCSHLKTQFFIIFDLFVIFHGLNLPYLEIIDCVPLKINCSHLKTQFFIIFDLFVIFYKAICISYAGRARLIMTVSLFY